MAGKEANGAPPAYRADPKKPPAVPEQKQPAASPDRRGSPPAYLDINKNEAKSPSPSPKAATASAKAANYIRLGKIGEGGFGSAFLVRRVNPPDPNTYVLKEIKCRDKDQVIDALREMVALRILQCPWVVRFEDYWQDGLSVFLVMEFCPGGDLYREMNEALKNDERLPEEKVMRWFTQAALGLNEIHQRGFMHRDIKPSNVFLDIHGNAHLGDFGLTKNFGGISIDSSYRGTICGTPGFLSPELQRGDKYNVKSDVWALGCTLYEMLVLRSAFEDSIEGVFPVEIPAYYSQALRDVLKKMLTEDMHERPHIETILKIDFVARYVAEVTGSVYRPADASAASSLDNLSDSAPDAPPFDLTRFARRVKELDLTAAFNDARAHPFIVATFAIFAFMILKIVRII